MCIRDRGESAAFAAAIEEARTARAHTPERTTFEHLHPELKRHRETAQLYALGLALAADCPLNDCRVYLNIFDGARELEAHGYLVRVRVRNENGQLGAIEYTILELPKEPAQKPAPVRENPIQVKPMLDVS